MKRWEYRFEEAAAAHGEVVSEADDFGRLGWELVTAELRYSIWYLVFKRPLPLGSKAPLGSKVQKRVKRAVKKA